MLLLLGCMAAGALAQNRCTYSHFDDCLAAREDDNPTNSGGNAVFRLRFGNEECLSGSNPPISGGDFYEVFTGGLGDPWTDVIGCAEMQTTARVPAPLPGSPLKDSLTGTRPDFSRIDYWRCSEDWHCPTYMHRCYTGFEPTEPTAGICVSPLSNVPLVDCTTHDDCAGVVWPADATYGWSAKAMDFCAPRPQTSTNAAQTLATTSSHVCQLRPQRECGTGSLFGNTVNYQGDLFSDTATSVFQGLGALTPAMIAAERKVPCNTRAYAVSYDGPISDSQDLTVHCAPRCRRPTSGSIERVASAFGVTYEDMTRMYGYCAFFNTVPFGVIDNYDISSSNNAVPSIADRWGHECATQSGALDLCGPDLECRAAEFWDFQAFPFCYGTCLKPEDTVTEGQDCKSDSECSEFFGDSSCVIDSFLPRVTLSDDNFLGEIGTGKCRVNWDATTGSPSGCVAQGQCIAEGERLCNEFKSENPAFAAEFPYECQGFCDHGGSGTCSLAVGPYGDCTPRAGYDIVCVPDPSDPFATSSDYECVDASAAPSRWPSDLGNGTPYQNICIEKETVPLGQLCVATAQCKGYTISLDPVSTYPFADAMSYCAGLNCTDVTQSSTSTTIHIDNARCASVEDLVPLDLGTRRVSPYGPTDIANPLLGTVCRPWRVPPECNAYTYTDDPVQTTLGGRQCEVDTDCPRYMNYPQLDGLGGDTFGVPIPDYTTVRASSPLSLSVALNSACALADPTLSSLILQGTSGHTCSPSNDYNTCIGAGTCSPFNYGEHCIGAPQPRETYFDFGIIEMQHGLCVKTDAAQPGVCHKFFTGRCNPLRDLETRFTGNFLENPNFDCPQDSVCQPDGFCTRQSTGRIAQGYPY